MITVEPRDSGCCDHCYRNTDEVPIVRLSAGIGVEMCPDCLAEVHRLTAPAEAVEAARVPCAGWVEVMRGQWLLDLGKHGRLRVLQQATDMRWVWWRSGETVEHEAESCDAAKIAAEDAAAELMTAGLRALGRAGRAK